MNILVTGGAGFIGSHFVLRHVALHADDKVIVIDSLNYAADQSFLGPVMSQIHFVEGDINNTELVRDLVERYEIDMIVNFAAETHVDRSIENAWPFLHTNILGTQTLIDICRGHPHILLVHVSTDEVYGEVFEDKEPRQPDAPLVPGNPYAATKAAADLLVLAAVRTYDIRARVTRCTNNYGPHQDASKLLPVIIKKALADEQIPIYGEGKQKRDWLYVTDHTDGIEMVIAKGEDGQVYHVSADDERENIETAKLALANLGKAEDLIQFVTDRPGHDFRYALNSQQLRALGWQPKVPFEQGLQQTIAWWQQR